MHHILVIDDDCSVLEVVRDMLSVAGYKVTATCNGKEGVELIKKQKFDLVLTDFRMPEVSGKDIAKTVKKKDSNTPVIIITGYAKEYDGTNPEQDGIDLLLSKPLDFQTLTMNVARIILASSGKETQALECAINSRMPSGSYTGK